MSLEVVPSPKSQVYCVALAERLYVNTGCWVQ